MQKVHNITEQEIIAGCLKGKPIYQKMLYDKYASKMYAICYRYASSQEQAQDMLQEGFIRVFEKLNTFKQEGSLEGWIRRVLITTALKIIKKENKLYVVSNSDNTYDQSVGNTTQAQINQKELMELIQQLPYGYRTVFNLYAIEGYSHQEIAESLGINEGTSKSQLSRARKMLQDLLHRYSKRKISNGER